MAYGCREAVSYSKKQEHEKWCPFVPCSCPIAYCNFEGSLEQLRRHFNDKHKKSAKGFIYNRPVSITLGVDEKFLILREETDGSLFILSNKVETLGNVITLSQIGPFMEIRSSYELTVKDEVDRRCTLRLQSLMRSTPKWVDSPASVGFLLVPSQFSCNSRQLKFILRFPS
ncbi:Detected protein of confused Function [Hibiscus syriacus]|uniref:Detected protein of confused Function n=1 Tax=Hibiscus syriacus TaxID=106335 RepID=A0A6A2ZST9_HIBSY|nr:Detected protein of confused Function [Hibiscus syriacus]